MSSPEIVILRALLDKESGYVSGTNLAKSLDMSRVAVWQYMEKLRHQGFGFEAVRARGYKLTSRPNQLNPSLIEAYLSSRQLAFGFDYFETIDSTNDEALRQLTGGKEAPFVIVAREQTRGRGRFGRTWHSGADGNLYVSFGFRPLVEPARMQTFTLWMGVNVCEVIHNFTHAVPGLKWPNDLLFDGRKAGGMLTEARMDADQIRDLVFGLGLNVNSETASWPETLHGRAISLAEHTRTPVDLNKFTAALIGRILDAYEQFISGAYEKTFAERWHRFDVLRGKTITIVQGSREVQGVATGIDNEGSLILRTDKGKSERFRAGEVTLDKNVLAQAAEG